jgi:hypothetical protein
MGKNRGGGLAALRRGRGKTVNRKIRNLHVGKFRT